jgi:hypothetical protein
LTNPAISFRVSFGDNKTQRLVYTYYVAEKNKHAVALGSIKSKKKARAARKNGKKGGRPKKVA